MNSDMPEGKNWGLIEPQAGGRWVWPFKHMEEGDWFTVRHEHRDPERVRQMASVRAAQLNKHFSVAKNWQPGVCRVTCVEEGRRQYGTAAPEVLEFVAVGEVIGRCYGLDSNQLAWTLLALGQSHRIEAVQKEEPFSPIYAVNIPDQWKFIIELDKRGVTLTRVDKWETVKSFTEKKLASIMD